MIEVGKLFYKYSRPLKEVVYLKQGDIYYNVEGHALEYIDKDEFKFIEGSPLVKGELITELSPKQLNLFWTLIKNKNIYGR
jgi:hypothetical protein